MRLKSQHLWKEGAAAQQLLLPPQASLILDDIVKKRKVRIEEKKSHVSLEEIMERVARSAPPARDFKASLRHKGRVSLIAEIKPASPVKGKMRENFDPMAIARAYEEGGASALSVLTEPDFFLGSTATLQELRQKSSLPLLCKDFFIDPYQVYEARALGADAILLIAAILDDRSLNELLELSHQLGMTALVEVHNQDELARAISAGAGLIGINNRNLRTFHTDISTTMELMPMVPPGATIVSESGIKCGHDMKVLRELGVHAALVGEALVTSPDIVAKTRELVAGGNAGVIDQRIIAQG